MQAGVLMDLIESHTLMGGNYDVKDHDHSIGSTLEPAGDLSNTIPGTITSSFQGSRGAPRSCAVYSSNASPESLVKATDSDLVAPEVASYPDIPDFRLILKIGEGAFSTVYKAVRKSNASLVALKIISKENLDPKQHDNVFREVILMKNVDHPNIVKLIDFRDTPFNYVLVLEFMSGGELYATLFDQVCFPESVCRNVMYQIAKALEYLHGDRGIVHRDIKLENILFNSKGTPGQDSQSKSLPKNEQVAADPDAGKNIGVVKIADFGLSKVIHNTLTVTPCGTVGYTAPEILKDEKYSKGVDVWALGCVLYTMLCGFPPFFDDSPKGLADKVSEGLYAFLSPWWDSISIESKDLITHLLEIDPKKRYTVKEFLSHPWMKGESFDSSYTYPQKLLSMRPEFPVGTQVCSSLNMDTSSSLVSGYSFIVENTAKNIDPEMSADYRLGRDLAPCSGPREISRAPSCPDYPSVKPYSNNAPDGGAPDAIDALPNEDPVIGSAASRRQNRETRAKYPLPLELCLKDIVAAPLSIYQGMNEDTDASSVLQFVKVYNGKGMVPAASSMRKCPSKYPSSATTNASPSLYRSSPDSLKDTTSAPTASPAPPPLQSSALEASSDQIPITDVKILHGLRRNVKSFKLDIGLSPLYNRRRRLRMGVAN